MRAVIFILAALLTLQPPTPILVGATFTSSTSAAITWQQPGGVGLTCLHRYYGAEWPSAVCYNDLPEGPARVDLPGALGPFYRPAYGDRYVLSFEGVPVGQATLGEAAIYTLYMPLAQKRTAPQSVVRLPWAGR